MFGNAGLGKPKNIGTLPILAGASLGLALLPGALRIPHYRRASLEGVATIDDAVQVCQQTGLYGWDLVTFGQQLGSRKFAIYSTINLWDTPQRAFAYGMGYCTQYNLALKQLLDRLGFTTQAVYCLKVSVSDNPDWTMGHTWLKVTIDGETRDVCAGRPDNEAGQVHFTPLLPVVTGWMPILFLSHLGMILFCGGLEWKALLTRTSPPAWTYKER